MCNPVEGFERGSGFETERACECSRPARSCGSEFASGNPSLSANFFDMMWIQKQLRLKAHSRGFHLITREVVEALPELRGIQTGMLQVFIQHTSASLTLNENASPEVLTDSETRMDMDIPWNIVVWDDPVNLMSYVVYVLQKIFGYNRSLATKLMLEVHNQGKSLVATEEREQAELHLHQLHSYGLQATLRRAE